MRPLKALGRAIVKVVGWLDARGGFVTAVATVVTAAATAVIALLTGVYVHYSRAQWQVMHDELPELRRSANAAKSAADAATAQVEPVIYLNTEIQFYHVEESKKIVVVGAIRNDGKTVAHDVRIATKLEFRNSRPLPSEYQFGDDDFKFSAPEVLHPYASPQDFGYFREDMGRPVSPEEYQPLIGRNMQLYLWGEIRYKDFNGVPAVRRTFCGDVPAKQVFAARSGPPEKLTEGAGYRGPFQDCDWPK